MSMPAQSEGDKLHVVTSDHMSLGRILAGRMLLRFAAILLAVMLIAQALYEFEVISFGFENWRPVLYA